MLCAAFVFAACMSFEVALHNVDAALPELTFKSESPHLPFEHRGVFDTASLRERATSPFRVNDTLVHEMNC